MTILQSSGITAFLLTAALTSSAHATTIVANNFVPGDAFTNATSSGKGQAIGASGWYYNNVRAGGVVGISTAAPRSGNGSASFDAPNSNAKADIEYLAGAVAVGANYAANASLGAFTSLNSMAYDWYRAGTSVAAPWLHASLRVLLDADGNLATTNDRGGLVFENVYNGLTTVAADQWVSETVTGNTKMWNFGLGLGFAYDIDGDNYAYDSSLADWQNFLPNAKIIGFSSGVGSGWGGFSGAVDNIAWTIANVTTTSNFEVNAPSPIPEPATTALLGLGLAGLLAMRRKSVRKNK